MNGRSHPPVWCKAYLKWPVDTNGIPFWGRCTTHFGLLQWGLGCSLGVQDFDPWANWPSSLSQGIVPHVIFGCSHLSARILDASGSVTPNSVFPEIGWLTLLLGGWKANEGGKGQAKHAMLVWERSHLRSRGFLSPVVKQHGGTFVELPRKWRATSFTTLGCAKGHVMGRCPAPWKLQMLMEKTEECILSPVVWEVCLPAPNLVWAEEQQTHICATVKTPLCLGLVGIGINALCIRELRQPVYRYSLVHFCAWMLGLELFANSWVFHETTKSCSLLAGEQKAAECYLFVLQVLVKPQ